MVKVEVEVRKIFNIRSLSDKDVKGCEEMSTGHSSLSTTIIVL